MIRDSHRVRTRTKLKFRQSIREKTLPRSGIALPPTRVGSAKTRVSQVRKVPPCGRHPESGSGADLASVWECTSEVHSPTGIELGVTSVT